MGPSLYLIALKIGSQFSLDGAPPPKNKLSGLHGDVPSTVQGIPAQGFWDPRFLCLFY